MATKVTSGSAEALDNKIHWHQTNLGHFGPKRRETLIKGMARRLADGWPGGR